MHLVWILAFSIFLPMGLAACVNEPSNESAADADTPSLPKSGSLWVNTTIEGSCTCWAAPPAASGRTDDKVHTFEVTSTPRNKTTLIRMEMTETPTDRAEFFVAPPSCKEPEVSDCRGQGDYSEEGHVFEYESPGDGTWRFVVYGAGPGATEVLYSFNVALQRSIKQ
jgi:hypothetical protein